MASWLMVESIEPCNASRLDCVTALAKRVTSTWWRSPARWSFAALSAAFSLRVRVRASMSVHVAATSAPTAMITSIQLRRRDRGCSATRGLRSAAAARDRVEGGDGGGLVPCRQFVQRLLHTDQAALQRCDEGGLLRHMRLRGGQGGLRSEELRAVLVQGG